MSLRETLLLGNLPGFVYLCNPEKQDAMEETTKEEKSLNFIEEIVEEDLQNGRYKSILTRFPPEPNGYLHIGHAKSICLNFGLAMKATRARRGAKVRRRPRAAATLAPRRHSEA